MSKRSFVFSSEVEAAKFCEGKPSLVCYQDEENAQIVHSNSPDISNRLRAIATEIPQE